jgi:hypothetical protein
LLIEESRTNLCTYSGSVGGTNWITFIQGTGVTPVVVLNAGTAPDGTNTASKVTLNKGVGTTSSDRSLLFQNIGGIVNGAVYSASIYVKAFDTPDVGKQIRLTADNMGATQVVLTSSWQRVVFSGATVATTVGVGVEVRGTNAASADVLVFGAQLEAGAFATSYIPTVASQVTRTADVATMTGTNFSDWYNASEGSFNVGFIFNSEPGFTSGGTSQRALYVSDGTTNNRMDIPRIETSSDRMFAIVQTAGSLDVFSQIDVLNTTNNTQYYVCFGYKVNNFAAAINGLTPLTDTVLNIPTVNQLRFGALTATTGLINGYVTNMEYFPQKLTNAEIRAFSKG